MTDLIAGLEKLAEKWKHAEQIDTERCAVELEALIAKTKAKSSGSNQQTCPIHKTAMTPHFYERGPNDPPGNILVCEECAKARAIVEGKD